MMLCSYCFLVALRKRKVSARAECVAELLVTKIVSAQIEAPMLFSASEDKHLKLVLDLE